LFGDNELRHGRVEELQIGFGELAVAILVDILVDHRDRRLARIDTDGPDDFEFAGPSSLVERIASFSHAMSTSPWPRSTKVVVDPRAPLSSTGTLRNSLAMKPLALAGEPYLRSA